MKEASRVNSRAHTLTGRPTLRHGLMKRRFLSFMRQSPRSGRRRLCVYRLSLPRLPQYVIGTGYGAAYRIFPETLYRLSPEKSSG